MVKRLFAIAFIFACASIAWLILGGTISERTHSSADRLRGRVQSVWGAPHTQLSAYAAYDVPVPYFETITEDETQRQVKRMRLDTHTVRPSASDIAVSLQNEPRQKGLLWYSTYSRRLSRRLRIRESGQGQTNHAVQPAAPRGASGL